MQKKAGLRPAFLHLRLHVCGISNTSNPEELRRIRAEQVREKALATASPHAEALFIACSQLPGMDIIPGLSAQLGRPVGASVMAAGWAGEPGARAHC